MGESVDDELRSDIAAMEAHSAVVSASLALQNMLLCAHSLGVGASAMTGPLVASRRLCAMLQVPPSWQILALVPMGYPAEVPSAKERKSVKKVTRWFR